MPGEKKALTKPQLVIELAKRTSLTKKEVQSMFVALEEIIEEQLGENGPGVISPLPYLIKILKVYQPAREEKLGVPNPFRPGELTDIAARPARNIVQVRAMKRLKRVVE